jgi:preprotein translocase subunit YajC
MLISEAFAASASPAGPGGNFSFLIMIALLFVVMYFFMIRPQQKRAKDHRMLVASLKRNDKVLTTGGIIGKVTRAGEGNEIEIEIAKEVKIKIDRNAVQSVLNRTPNEPTGAQPANDGAGKPVNPLKRLFGGR